MRRKRERRNQSNVSLNTHVCVKANISELICNTKDSYICVRIVLFTLIRMFLGWGHAGKPQ